MKRGNLGKFELSTDEDDEQAWMSMPLKFDLKIKLFSKFSMWMEMVFVKSLYTVEVEYAILNITS